MAGPWEQYAPAAPAAAATGPWTKYAGAPSAAPDPNRELIGGKLNDQETAHYDALKKQGYPENYAKLMARSVSRPDEIYADGKKPNSLEFIAGIEGAGAFGPEFAAKNAIMEVAGGLEANHPHVSGALKFAADAIPTSVPQRVGMALGGKAMEEFAAAAKPVAQGAISVLSEKLGGVSHDAANLLEKNAPLVLHYARLGADKASESAAAASKGFQKSVGHFMDEVSDKYEQVAIQGVKDKYGEGWRTNLQKALGDALVYARQEIGYGDPKGFADETGEKTFQKIARVIDESKDATPDDVFKFQKRLNMALRSAQGKDSSLTAALGRIKGDLVKHLENTMPEIQQGNSIYRAGKELEEGLSKVTNADAAVRVINTALRNKGATRDAIVALTKRFPEAQGHLDDMLAASAGKEYAAWSRYLPNNGLLGSVMLGIGAGAKEMGAAKSLPYVAGAAAATSPRLYAEMGGLAARLPEVAASPASGVAGAVAGSLTARLAGAGLSDRARRLLGLQ